MKFDLYVCHNCLGYKDAINFAECCITKHLNYKKTLIHLIFNSDLLPSDLKEMIVSYCNFFPFDDYMETKGFTMLSK
jgi:hypothetical protein